MEQQGLNEALALYRASVRKAPALMMETVSVDSNRGATSRGNSPYDKYSSPETRAKVLESRMQEIAAFAQSRSIPASNLYALAEAAMRTGKIPDLGQFGLAGDDAVATKQFMLSNVLNIAGLEWTDYKGDPVEEADEAAREREAEAAEREARQKKLGARRRAHRTTGGYEMSDTSFDPSRYMSEEGLVGGPESANSSPARTSDGGEPDPQNYEKKDLLPKKVMSELLKQVGKGIYGYSREDLFRLARERGLLGTEEDVEGEGDVVGEGIVAPLVRAGTAIAKNPTVRKAAVQAGSALAAKAASHFMKKSNPAPLGENAAHLGAAAASTGGTGLSNRPGPSTKPYDEKEEGKESRRVDAHDAMSSDKGYADYMAQSARERDEKSVKEDRRSDSDKILGIEHGDPRGDTWPKLGGEMARLLNLENCGVFRGPRGFNLEGYTKAEPIQEMTTSAGMGGFIGGGMMGGGMTGRTCAMPAYDASYELPEDPEKRIAVLKKMLGKHGLKAPVQEAVETYEPAPNSTEVPVVRSPDYDSHPSRFMKK